MSDFEDFIQKNGWKVGLAVGVPLGAVLYKHVIPKVSEMVGKKMGEYQNPQVQNLYKKIEELSEKVDYLGKKFESHGQ